MRTIKALAVALVMAGMAMNGCNGLVYMTGRKTMALQDENARARAPVYHLGQWTIARASMHNHTIFSDGAYTPEDLAKLAHEEGMAILAYTDHREKGVCFTEKLCMPINGIEKVGYEAYFDRIAQVRTANPDLIVLSGAEVVPYFFNVGRAPNFVIFGENRHFTVYNIKDPKILWDMPARREMRDLSPETIPGLTPYESFVDYITAHGGIVHAVHVESQQDGWYGPAHFISPAPMNHIHDLKVTDFSILPEAYHRRAGGPGGGWDSALVEYLVGMRDQVPWAMGDADFHGPDGSLARATTLFYMREFTEDEVYKCLREGRMVALMGESFQDSYVSEFSVTDKGQPPDPIMFGQKTWLSGPPVIRFSLDHEAPEVKTLLIRNGVVIHEVSGCSFEYEDREPFEKNLPAVYRVEMRGPKIERDEKDIEHRKPGSLEPESELFTNPVFVYMRK